MPIKNFLILMSFILFSSHAITAVTDEGYSRTSHPYIFHLVQAKLWQSTVSKNGGVYYPPTYDLDGFTHGTANPNKLLVVANHFYREVDGDWLCLRMTSESLKRSGVEVVFEGTAPVGDKPADFEGSDDELYPHILGGITPDAVLAIHKVIRNDSGDFIAIDDLEVSDHKQP